MKNMKNTKNTLKTRFDANFDADLKYAGQKVQIGLVLELLLIYHLSVKTTPIWNLGDIEVSIFSTFLHQSYAKIPAESRMVWQCLWIALAVAQIAGKGPEGCSTAEPAAVKRR